MIPLAISFWSWFTWWPSPPPPQEPYVLYPAPGATVGIAWGNGKSATVASYEPLFAWLRANGVSVAAATSSNVGAGDIIKAGEALKARGCTRIVAVGHSQGGSYALEAARQRPDLFHAVCPIMPGAYASNWWQPLPKCPAFFVTGDLDMLSRPADVESRLVARYPGPVLHATRKGIDHWDATLDAAEIREYVRLFVRGDPAIDAIYDDQNWQVW